MGFEGSLFSFESPGISTEYGGGRPEEGEAAEEQRDLRERPLS
jgi:hypothetical protein